MNASGQNPLDCAPEMNAFGRNPLDPESKSTDSEIATEDPDTKPKDPIDNRGADLENTTPPAVGTSLPVGPGGVSSDDRAEPRIGGALFIDKRSTGGAGGGGPSPPALLLSSPSGAMGGGLSLRRRRGLPLSPEGGQTRSPGCEPWGHGGIPKFEPCKGGRLDPGREPRIRTDDSGPAWIPYLVFEASSDSPGFTSWAKSLTALRAPTQRIG